MQVDMHYLNHTKKMRRIEEQNQLLNKIIKVGLKDIITSRAYADIGRNIAIKGDYDSALQYLNAALADEELMESVDNEMIIRLKITMVYALKYQYVFEGEKNSPDLENFRKHQYEIETKFEHSSLKKNLYYGFLNNVAVVSGVFEEGLLSAIDSYSQSLEYYRSHDNSYVVNLLLSNIGNCVFKIGEF